MRSPGKPFNPLNRRRLSARSQPTIADEARRGSGAPMTTVPEIGKHREPARAASARSDATAPLLETSRARRKLSDLDGPAGLPLVGNAFGIDVERIHLQLEHWARLYGPLYRLNVVGRQIMVVADPKISEQLLRARPKSLRRIGSLERVFVEMGTAGVFSAEGDAWRAQRRLATQALSNRHLRTFFPTLQRVALSLRERWGRHAAGGESVDIDDDLMRFTVDVTTSLVFGTDLQTLDRGESELHGHLARVFPAFTSTVSIDPTARDPEIPVAGRHPDRPLHSRQAQ